MKRVYCIDWRANRQIIWVGGMTTLGEEVELS